MISIITPKKAQKALASNTRKRRLHMALTQEALAQRSGVALSTLRKFEQQGMISLESFIKLQWVLGGLEELIQATDLPEPEYTSIDEVLKDNSQPTRQRGKKK
jgi:transcriptional regulator with XRE-family HTH domain